MNTSPVTMAAATTADAEASRTTVAVIEDDEGICEVLRELLEDEGYHVVEARDGVSGLALLKSHSEPLVVLLDHHLPKMDGCDLLDLVAQDATLREQRVFLLVTGAPHKVEEDCGESVDELDATVLGKPFDIYQVLDAIADAALRLSGQGG